MANLWRIRLWWRSMQSHVCWTEYIGGGYNVFHREKKWKYRLRRWWSGMQDLEVDRG